MAPASIGAWIGFHVLVLSLLAFDLGVLRRRARVMSMREAALWTTAWIGLAAAFNVFVWWQRGANAALEFATGYLIEYSLSVDNIFVFVLIFTTFAVPRESRHRVLFWGILAAFLLRGTLILAGVALIARFHWIVYVFGAFLLFTGVKLAFAGGDPLRPEEMFLVRLARRVLPIVPEYDGSRFVVRRSERLMATPLLLVLLCVEVVDVIFALDSIPAIFAITRDAFVAYTSNIFAVLGLRSLYFLLEGAVSQFRYLKPALCIILVFVGLKMLLSGLFHVPTALSLGFIALVLGVAIAASIRHARRATRAEA